MFNNVLIIAGLLSIIFFSTSESRKRYQLYGFIILIALLSTLLLTRIGYLNIPLYSGVMLSILGGIFCIELFLFLKEFKSRTRALRMTVILLACVYCYFSINAVQNGFGGWDEFFHSGYARHLILVERMWTPFDNVLASHVGTGPIPIFMQALINYPNEEFEPGIMIVNYIIGGICAASLIGPLSRNGFYLANALKIIAASVMFVMTGHGLMASLTIEWLGSLILCGLFLGWISSGIKLPALTITGTISLALIKATLFAQCIALVMLYALFRSDARLVRRIAVCACAGMAVFLVWDSQFWGLGLQRGAQSIADITAEGLIGTYVETIRYFLGHSFVIRGNSFESAVSPFLIQTAFVTTLIVVVVSGTGRVIREFFLFLAMILVNLLILALMYSAVMGSGDRESLASIERYMAPVLFSIFVYGITTKRRLRYIIFSLTWLAFLFTVNGGISDRQYSPLAHSHEYNVKQELKFLAMIPSILHQCVKNDQIMVISDSLPNLESYVLDYHLQALGCRVVGYPLSGLEAIGDRFALVRLSSSEAWAKLSAASGLSGRIIHERGAVLVEIWAHE
jgi:hypothetical protein